MPWKHTDSLDESYAALEQRPQVVKKDTETESTGVGGFLLILIVLTLCALALGVALRIIKLF